MKKNILLVLIGIVIGITSTVLASNYLASEVVYNDTTVDSALDELYTRTDTTITNLNNQIEELNNNMSNTIAMNTFGTPLYHELYGNGDGNRTASINLSKGKYLVVATNGYGWTSGNITTPESNENYQSDSVSYKNNIITCTNCDKTYLSGYYNLGASTVLKSNVYAHLSMANSVYIVNMKSSGNVSINSTINADHARHAISIIAIPINS